MFVPYSHLLDGYELLGVGIGYNSRTTNDKVLVVKGPIEKKILTELSYTT